MTEKLHNFQMNFQTKDGRFFISETPIGQSSIFMLRSCDKGGHLARAVANKAMRESGLTKGELLFDRNIKRS